MVKSFLNENDNIYIKLINSENSNIIYEDNIDGNSVSYSIGEIHAGSYILHIEKK